MIKIPSQKKPNLLKARLLRNFSRRYRVRHAVGKEPVEIRGVFQNCILTADRKLLFLKNSKSGCTSIAQIMVHYSTGKFSDKVHVENSGVLQGFFSYPEIREAFDNSNTFCFSISRHPADRLQSCFFNFFADKKNLETQRYLPAIKARGFDEKGDIDRNYEIFVDFVEEALSDTRLRCDPHWREQHVNMGFGRLPYDYIMKLENYRSDIQHVFENAGLGQLFPSFDRMKRFNQSSRANLSVSSRMVSKIENMYAEDYEIFGY